jgi:hypothetical protein
MVWPWYSFAFVFPLITVLYMAPPWNEKARAQIADKSCGGQSGVRSGEARTAAVWSLGLAAYAGCIAVALILPSRAGHENNFDAINRLALTRFGPVLRGARVAMGDRAGSFAMAYGGPVVQLEGIVNDKAYLDALRRRADLRPLLCGRGVRFVVDYQPDLGAYDHLWINAMRPYLTQFLGPGLDVWRADEVGRIQNLALYDNRRKGESGNSSLYIWRLRCGSPRTPGQPTGA